MSREPASLNTRQSDLGAYLRQLRQRRGLSLAVVAARAGVSERSLSRWENGAVRPRLPELEQAMRALGASGAEAGRALALVGTARALRRQQEEAAGAAVLPENDLVTPGAGALLRSLRQRRGLSLAEASACLGVQPSSISRWERGQ